MSSSNLVQFPTTAKPISEELEQQLIFGKIPKYKGNISAFIDKQPLNRVELKSNQSVKSSIRGESMTSEKDLVQLQLKHLEEQFETKLNARDQLIDSKFELVNKNIDNIQTKILSEMKVMHLQLGNQITESIQSQKDVADEKQKETKKFILTAIGVVATVATLVVTIAIPIVQNYFTIK